MAHKDLPFLLAFLLMVPQSTTAQIDCKTCIQTICAGFSGGGCRFIQQPNETCITTSCNARKENAIIRCDSKTQSLLRLADLTTSPDNCVENRRYINGQPRDLDTGFYIVGNFLRFCSTHCFSKILIGSRENPNLPITQNPIQFHVYKRYYATNRDYFIEQQNFSVSLMHDSNESVYEATPIGPSVCIDSGDYVGMTLTEDIGLVGIDGTAVSGGSYVNVSSSSQCSGITSPVFNLIPFSDGLVPRITVETMLGHASTSTVSQTTLQATVLLFASTSPTRTALIVTVVVISSQLAVAVLIILVVLYIKHGRRKKGSKGGKQDKHKSSLISSKKIMSRISALAKKVSKKSQPAGKTLSSTVVGEETEITEISAETWRESATQTSLQSICNWESTTFSSDTLNSVSTQNKTKTGTSQVQPPELGEKTSTSTPWNASQAGTTDPNSLSNHKSAPSHTVKLKKAIQDSKRFWMKKLSSSVKTLRPSYSHKRSKSVSSSISTWKKTKTALLKRRKGTSEVQPPELGEKTSTLAPRNDSQAGTTDPNSLSNHNTPPSHTIKLKQDQKRFWIKKSSSYPSFSHKRSKSASSSRIPKKDSQAGTIDPNTLSNHSCSFIPKSYTRSIKILDEEIIFLTPRPSYAHKRSKSV